MPMRSPLVPPQHHPSHPLFTLVPPSQYSQHQPVPLQPCLLNQPPVSTPPVSLPHPCPPNPVSTPSLVKHTTLLSNSYYILFKLPTVSPACLCSTVVLPATSHAYYGSWVLFTLRVAESCLTIPSLLVLRTFNTKHTGHKHHQRQRYNGKEPSKFKR